MPYFGDFYIAEIESSHIAEYRKLRLQQKAKSHDNPVSPATVNREVILLKSMLKKAAEWYVKKSGKSVDRRKFGENLIMMPVGYDHDGNILHRVKRLVFGIGYVRFFPEKRKRKSCQSFITVRPFPKTMK
jgi:hypothetical protein